MILNTKSIILSIKFIVLAQNLAQNGSSKMALPKPAGAPPALVQVDFRFHTAPSNRREVWSDTVKVESNGRHLSTIEGVLE